MKLHLVDNRDFAVKESGMKFLFEDGAPVGFGVSEELKSADHTGRKVDDLHDSLYDGDCAIYKDDEGYLYGVEMFYDGEKFIPGVWQRIG